MSIEVSSRFESAAVTHPGKVREANEDSHLTRDLAGIWAVADGMGGHACGDVASQMMIEALLAVAPPGSAAELLAQCEACVVDVNERILAMAAERNVVIGTTLAMLLNYGVDYACIWSGDSRIYRVRDRQIAMLSRDHTEVQELVDRGILTMEESRASPLRNIVTRAIGVSTHAELEMARGTVYEGDIFLLCTDGLTNHVSNDELLSNASRSSSQLACHALVDLALQRGGTDNVTVIVVRYVGRGDAADLQRRSSDTIVELAEPMALAVAPDRGMS